MGREELARRPQILPLKTEWPKRDTRMPKVTSSPQNAKHHREKFPVLENGKNLKGLTPGMGELEGSRNSWLAPLAQAVWED